MFFFRFFAGRDLIDEKCESSSIVYDRSDENVLPMDFVGLPWIS